MRNRSRFVIPLSRETVIVVDPLPDSSALKSKASSACAGAAIALEPRVQRGDGSDVSGFPPAADMHTNISKLSPELEIRLKEI
jgi:hypothetical protein